MVTTYTLSPALVFLLRGVDNNCKTQDINLLQFPFAGNNFPPVVFLSFSALLVVVQDDVKILR